MILVDGHNLIGRTPGLSFGDEPGAREGLLRWLAARKGSGREAVVVVFDGNRPGAAGEERFGGVRVVYAPAGRSADDEILRRLASGQASGAMVVTSDRELSGRARGLGARVETCEAFRGRVGPGPRRPDPDAKPAGGPAEVAEWLDLFRSRTGGGGHKI